MNNNSFDLNEFLKPVVPQQDDRYRKAVEIHSMIMNVGQTVAQGIYTMGKGFKTMRDEKLYEPLGYSNFADYCETETGIKRTQVYAYIGIVEKLPESYVIETKVGVEKLKLLSTLPDEERKEVVEAVDIESSTIRELKEKIKELQEQNKELEVQKADKHDVKVEETEEYIALKNTNDAMEIIRKQQEERINTLKAELEEIRASAEETAEYDIEENEDYKRLKADVDDYRTKVSDKDKRITELEKEISELESKPEIVAVESNEEDKAEIKRLSKELEKAQKELARSHTDIEKTEDKAFMIRMSMSEFKSILNELEAHCLTAIFSAL